MNSKLYSKTYRRNHSEAYKLYQRRYIANLKLDVFGHYCGGKNKIRCQCKGCPIRHIDLLSMDHKKPWRGRYKTSGRNFWRATKHDWNLWLWLKKKNYPSGFQILCLACNKAKGVKERCPRYGKRH